MRICKKEIWLITTWNTFYIHTYINMLFIEYIAKVHETIGKASVPTICSVDSKLQLTQSYHYRPELHFLHSNSGEPTGSSNGQGSSSSLWNVANLWLLPTLTLPLLCCPWQPMPTHRDFSPMKIIALGPVLYLTVIMVPYTLARWTFWPFSSVSVACVVFCLFFFVFFYHIYKSSL